MRIDLSGRTALVTGSTGGIGRAIATGLAQSGAFVILNGRTRDRLEAAVDAVTADADAAGRVRGVVADVATAEGCAAVTTAEPDVDILVANAGVFTPMSVFQIPDEEWTRVFDVNVMHAVRLARHYVPRMVTRNWGRVQFVSSESAIQIPAEMVHYGMSKAAMLAVSRGFAESVPATGVTVNAILPGPTRTEGVEEFLRHMVADEDGVDSVDEAGMRFIARERPTSLLKRLIEPEEVANLSVYLASEQASATTGAALRVDGGVIRAAIG
jgi:NAD(P)-dependent dehydrogenase (short-subunit alcohol dehydrogenase family)